MNSPATTVETPRLRRSLTLWDLILYGVIVIQPVAPMSVFGVLSDRGGARQSRSCGGHGCGRGAFLHGCGSLRHGAPTRWRFILYTSFLRPSALEHEGCSRRNFDRSVELHWLRRHFNALRRGGESATQY